MNGNLFSRLHEMIFTMFNASHLSIAFSLGEKAMLRCEVLNLLKYPCKYNIRILT